MIRSLFMVITSVLCATVMLAQAPAANSIMKIADNYDWGTRRLPAAGFLETELTIENIAKNGMLKIIEITPGCGCTKTDPDRTDLNPGEIAHVKVKLNVTPSQSGSMSKSIMIRGLHGTDTLTKVVMLQVNLDRVLHITPSTFISFNNATVGAESRVTSSFENPSDMPVTISKLSIDGDVKVDLKDNSVIAPHSKVDVTMSITPVKAGQIYGALRFTASGNGDPEDFILPAYGQVPTVPGK